MSDEATTRPALTLSEAARATGKHRNTVRNALDSDRFPNAYRDGAGTWRIPVGDLLAAGFPLHAPAGPDAEDATQGHTNAATAGDDAERLRADVDDLRRRLAVAEALAAERGRELERLWAMLPAMLPARTTGIRWPWSARRNRD